MICMIAAVGKNGELGKNGGLIWNLPNDLKFFKSVTTGSMVAMGKNTYNSLPKRLTDRKHVVLTYDLDFNKSIDGVTLFCEKEEFIDFIVSEAHYHDVYIIGGASVYNMFIDLADVIYLTEIDATDSAADVYFPKMNKSDWCKESISNGADGNIKYEHVKYTRK